MSLYADIELARRHVDVARRQLRRLLLTAVARRDGTLCHYCQVPTILSRTGHPRRRTLDHIQPVSQGGTDDLENLVLACSSCNSRKGTRPARVFGHVRGEVTQ